MKKLIAVALIAMMPIAFAAEEKRVCVKEFDNKTNKEKEVCKTIKVHKKLEGTSIEDAKKDGKK